MDKVWSIAKIVVTSVFGLVVGTAILMLPFFYVFGIAAVLDYAMPWVLTIAGFALIACVVVVLPLSLIPKIRGLCGLALYFLALPIGLYVWLHGFSIIYFYWSTIGVVLSMFLTGGMVVPAALVALLLHGEWVESLYQLLSVAILFGLKITANKFTETA